MSVLFDGDIPTSTSVEPAEFHIDGDYSVLIVSPTMNENNNYSIGVCSVFPFDYFSEEECKFNVVGAAVSTLRSAGIFIKRSGDTFYVRGSSIFCRHLTIYGI